MRKVLVSLFLMLVTIVAYAQFKPTELDKHHGKIVYYQNGEPTDAGLMNIIGREEYSSYQSARALKGWGRGLLIGGGATAAAGAGILAIIATQSKEKLDSPTKGITGAMIGVGVAVAIPGIILLSIGNSKVNHIIERYNMSVTPNGIAFVF